MTLAKNGVRCLAGGVIAVLALAACSSSKGGGGGGGGGTSAAPAQSKGGTLYINDFRNFSHTDPQRVYVGSTLSFITRTMTRTLENFPAKEGADGQAIIPDMATDLGQKSADAKTWTFTLRPDIKWQDGKPVTCADFQYGISRTFAQNDGITSGPVYALDYLDIPRDAKGQPIYTGPYHKQTAAAQAAYDKAVQCPADNKIEFHLRHPVADFNNTVTLTAFSPVRKDKDTGAKFDNTPFSDGPYMVQGAWDLNHGGTLVRNPNWVEASDPLRKAYPDKIVVTFGDTGETVYSKIQSDSGTAKNTVTYTVAPASSVAAILGAPSMKSRSTDQLQTFVDYLSINVKHIPSQQVRQAIAMAVSRSAYNTAWGGATAGTPTNSIMSPLLKAYTKYDPFGVGLDGDTAKAKAMLQQAGKVGMQITYDYPKSNTQDKVATNIKSELEAAGFKVKLNGLGDNFYDVIGNPSQTSDVTWAGWDRTGRPDRPSSRRCSTAEPTSARTSSATTTPSTTTRRPTRRSTPRCR